jgi:hypothetical protein
MLNETRRAQLDGIVQQMVKNKEPDSNVQFVVDDFKKKYENEATPIQSKQPQKGFIQKASEFVPNLVAGAAKGVGSTIAGAASLGEKVLQAPLKVLGMKTSEQTGAEQLGLQKKLQPTNTAQKLGFGAEQVAEFFVPGGAAGKVGKAAELGAGANKFAKAIGTGTKLATEGLAGSGINATQQGGGDNFTLNAILYGTLSGLGSAVSKAGQVLTKKLPTSLVNTAIKPTLEESRKAIKFKGDTLGDEVLKRGLAGGDKRLLEIAVEKINKTENRLQSILGKSQETIKRNELGVYLDNLIETKRATPGLGSEVDKVKSILQEFPEEVPIQKANEIKRNIYNALRDVAYKLDPALSTNKEAMKTLANGIKQEIEKKTAGQVGEGVVKGINKDLSVYGKIQDRVVDKLARAERNNLLGLGDLVTMGAGAGAGGLPGAITSYITKKVVGSTAFKTNSAKVLYNLGKVLDKLPTDKAGNVSKNAIFKAIQSLNN